MSVNPNDHPVIGPDHQLPAPPKSHRKGMQVIVWILVLLVFAGAIYLVLAHHADTKAAAPRRGAGSGPATITETTAQKGDIGVYIDAIGTVTPVYTASITSQVNGVVTAVHYREGQLIHKGDPLLDIDDRTYRATLLQAQGLLDRDQGLLAQAKMDMVRYQEAWKRNAIPKQTLDDEEKVVDQDEGTVKNDAGTVAYDQIEVDYCHITAPITGRVGLRLVDPGNVVQATGSTVLAVITQMQPITVIFTIPEDSLGQVQTQTKKGAKLTVDAYDRTDQHKIASGTLLTLDNQIDTTTGTVKARAQFTNSDSSLFPNQFVNARLLVTTLKGATLIPTSTIQHNGQAAFVYVIVPGSPKAPAGASAGGSAAAAKAPAAGGAKKDKTAGAASNEPAAPALVAKQKAIKVGVTNGNTSQVTGINPGDVLANSSFDKLQDDTAVIVSKQPPPQSTSLIGSSAP